MEDRGGISTGWITAIYGIIGVLCGVAAARGVLGNQDDWVLVGMLGLVIVLCTLPLALKRTGADAPAPSKTVDHELHEIRNQFRTLSKAISDLQESIILSDDARRVLNRKRERDILCKAINEDIQAEDWDAAMVLIRELAERFGYRGDAEQFREKVETARFTTVDRRVNEALSGLDDLIARCEWDAAMNEAARIARLFPDSPKAEGLRHRVGTQRDRFKIELERRFLHAAQADQIEDAMDLLKQMDQYLTEVEAERFHEVARGVIGKARENLGAAFKLAIQDRMWERAVDLGERIIEEFPNSRMAEEVRGMIDGLRERAGVLRGS